MHTITRRISLLCGGIYVDILILHESDLQLSNAKVEYYQPNG